MRKPALTVAAVILATATAGTAFLIGPAGPSDAAAPAATGVQRPASSLRWGACPADAFQPPTVSRPECTTVDVPLDYRNPTGATLSIAVSRLVSPDPAKRRGILLTNSGGPGGTGLRFPADLADAGKTKAALPKEVRDSYDLVSFDPRGVGHSAPVTCALTPEQTFSSIPPYARNAVDVAKQAGVARTIAGQCGSSASASLQRYVSTANTARDMDRIRIALGEAKASYLGISYGTYLGAAWATMFPATTDRVVLDSSTGPGGWDYAFQRNFAQGFADRFPDFAKFVAARPQYGLGRTPQQVTAKYHELARKLDRVPVGSRTAGMLFRQTTFTQLYYDSKFPELAEIWRASDTGSGAAPAGKPGDQPNSKADGAAPLPPADNYLASQAHVLCNDSTWPRSMLTYQRNVAVDRLRFPLFGAAAANVPVCAFWPDRVEKPVTITADGPANILISQNLRDPATPLNGARAMDAALGQRSRLVTADQGGHLAYLFKGNRCLNDAVTRYLATGVRPARDVACKAEQS